MDIDCPGSIGPAEEGSTSNFQFSSPTISSETSAAEFPIFCKVTSKVAGFPGYTSSTVSSGTDRSSHADDSTMTSSQTVRECVINAGVVNSIITGICSSWGPAGTAPGSSKATETTAC